jgi:hypothetical protein
MRVQVHNGCGQWEYGGGGAKRHKGKENAEKDGTVLSLSLSLSLFLCCVD